MPNTEKPARPPEYGAATGSTEPCRRAFSREEMIEEAKAYMRETWGPCRESEDRDRWHERLGMLVDFIHDRFPSNAPDQARLQPSPEAGCSPWKCLHCGQRFKQQEDAIVHSNRCKRSPANAVRRSVKYECFIKPGYHCQYIEADNSESARRQFAELIRDNLEAEHIIANNLDTNDGEDPSPNAEGESRAASARTLHPLVGSLDGDK